MNRYNQETGTARSITFRLFVIMMLAWVLSLSGYATCHAETVTLSWDPNTDANLAGYKVYYKADTSTLPFNGIGAVEGASPLDVHILTTATVSGLDPNKTYYFAVTAYDTAGVESSYSNIVTVAEGVPPTASITSPANNTAVSGTVSVAASASDNVGVTKVEFYLNGVLQATDTATPYVYSWNTAALASGTYTLMAKAYDAAGNVGQSGNVAVTVVNDTTVPVVSLTAPGNSATVSGTVAITASASDNVGVSKVEFYENGVLLYAGNVAPFSYSWNTTSVANGSYTLQAKAYDNAGNIGQSSNVAVTVLNDATPPAVTAFTMPTTASATTVAVSSFTATDNTRVTGYLITESATAPAANAAGWSSSAPASFTFAGSGTRTAYAWAKDAANNISASLSATVGIILPDTTAPTVAISAPVSNATVSGIVAVNATANDNLGVSKVEFYINGTLQSSSTASPYSFNWDTNIVKDGNYTLSAKAYDTTGNVGQSTDTAIYVNNGATLPSGTYSALFGNAAGSDYPNTIEDTYINVNNGVNSASQTLNTYTWPAQTPANAILMKWNLSALPANAQIQSATMYLYLNGSGGDDLYEIPVSEVINKVPVIAASTGYTYDGVNPWTPSSVPYNSIPLAQSDISPAVDAPLIDKAYGYKKWNVTKMVQDWVVTPDANKGLLLNSSNKASSDSNRMFASSDAVDANLRPRLVVVYTVPDTTLPTVSIDSPSNNATVSGTVSVTASASDNVAVTKVEFYVNGVLTSTSSAAPYSYSWNTASVANGAYTLTAKAYDAAGNVGQSANVTATVFNDAIAPTVSITAPASNATVSGTVSVTASASDNIAVTKVEFYVNGVLKSSSQAAPYIYSWNTTQLINGSYTLSAIAYDSAGNVGRSASQTVTVNNLLSDRTAPTVTTFTVPATATTLNVPVTSFTATDNVVVAGYIITEKASTPAKNAVGWSSVVPKSYTFASAGSKTLYAWAKDSAGNVSAAKRAKVIITY